VQKKRFQIKGQQGSSNKKGRRRALETSEHQSSLTSRDVEQVGNRDKSCFRGGSNGWPMRTLRQLLADTPSRLPATAGAEGIRYSFIEWTAHYSLQVATGAPEVRVLNREQRPKRQRLTRSLDPDHNGRLDEMIGRQRGGRMIIGLLLDGGYLVRILTGWDSYHESR